MTQVDLSLKSSLDGLVAFSGQQSTLHTTQAKAAVRLMTTLFLSLASLILSIAGVIGALLVNPFLAFLAIPALLLGAVAALILIRTKAPAFDPSQDKPHLSITFHELPSKEVSPEGETTAKKIATPEASQKVAEFLGSLMP